MQALAAAQGLHGLHFAAAHGLTFFGAHWAIAGVVRIVPVRATPPAATPTTTTNGTIVVDIKIRFLDCIASLPDSGLFDIMFDERF